MASDKARKKAQKKYGQTHPCVSFRVTIPEYDELKAYCEDTGLSFADLIKLNLKSQKEKVDAKVLELANRRDDLGATLRMLNEQIEERQKKLSKPLDQERRRREGELEAEFGQRKVDLEAQIAQYFDTLESLDKEIDTKKTELKCLEDDLQKTEAQKRNILNEACEIQRKLNELASAENQLRMMIVNSMLGGMTQANLLAQKSSAPAPADSYQAELQPAGPIAFISTLTSLMTLCMMMMMGAMIAGTPRKPKAPELPPRRESSLDKFRRELAEGRLIEIPKSEIKPPEERAEEENEEIEEEELEEEGEEED